MIPGDASPYGSTRRQTRGLAGLVAESQLIAGTGILIQKTPAGTVVGLQPTASTSSGPSYAIFRSVPSPQTLPGGGSLFLDFGPPNTDTDGYANVDTTKINFPAQGLYSIHASVQIAAPSAEVANVQYTLQLQETGTGVGIGFVNVYAPAQADMGFGSLWLHTSGLVGIASNAETLQVLLAKIGPPYGNATVLYGVVSVCLIK